MLRMSSAFLQEVLLVDGSFWVSGVNMQQMRGAGQGGDRKASGSTSEFFQDLDLFLYIFISLEQIMADSWNPCQFACITIARVKCLHHHRVFLTCKFMKFHEFGWLNWTGFIEWANINYLTYSNSCFSLWELKVLKPSVPSWWFQENLYRKRKERWEFLSTILNPL